MIDYSQYRKSLQHLENQFYNYRLHQNQYCRGQDNLKEIDREAIAESVIQRFEVCYDCLWKVLKRYMREVLGIPNLPNSPKPVFRIAFENHLLTAIEPWLSYANTRVDTSHDYSEIKAQETLTSMEDFIKEAIELYSRITGELWEQNLLI